MKKNLIRLFSLTLCVLTVLLLPVQVLAEGPIDTDAECYLDVSFIPEETPAVDVEFKIYRIASVSSSGDFTLIEPFNLPGLAEILAEPDADGYRVTATTLKGFIASDDTIEPTATAKTNIVGHAEFINLKTGLYMITGTGFEANGFYYTPQDYLVCIPERTENHEWTYNVESSVKWEKRTVIVPMTLEVLKIWADSATNLHVSDGVTVELYRDGFLYDTKVLYQGNGWTYRWEELDSACEWTLTEQHLEGYHSTVEKSGNIFVVTNYPDKTDTPDNPLPQTGLLWWPVPVLAAAGLVFIMIGLLLRNRGKRNES